MNKTSFVPKKGGHYWYVSSTCFIGCETYIHLGDNDLLRIGQNNAFQTREEAEDYCGRMVQKGKTLIEMLK